MFACLHHALLAASASSLRSRAQCLQCKHACSSACHAEEASILWGFITRYAPDATPEAMPALAGMVENALNYYQDFIKPHKQYRDATEDEKKALTELADSLEKIDANSSAEDLQTLIFTVGKNHNYENLRDWFKALYQILLGQEQGPRFGSFIELYGIDETVVMIRKACG